jgi:hypothetical protein
LSPSRRALVTVSALSSIVIVAGIADERGEAGTPLAAQSGPTVLVRTTGNRSETRETVPITRHAGSKKAVVMSMGANTLPQLVAHDRLKVTSELQVTDDCNDPEPRCAGHPYQYNPKIGSHLVLASSPHATGGPHVVSVSPRKVITCLQEKGNRQHHCVIAFSDAGLHVKDPADIPCLPDSCHLNFVVDARNHRARHGDKLVIGGNQPSGRIAQDKGRINVIRLRPGSQPKAPATVTRHRLHKRISLHLHSAVIASKRLRGLKRHEQLAVYARFHTDISHLPYSTRVTSQLVLADRRSQTGPGHLAARVSSTGAEIDEANGSNCVHVRNPCRYTKVGVLTMQHDAESGGDPVPLFVNLWLKSKPKLTTPKPGDQLRIRDAKLKIVRYPADLHP